MSHEELKKIVSDVKNLTESDLVVDRLNEVSELGARILIFIDKIIKTSERASIWIPKDFFSDQKCILGCLFSVLEHIPKASDPFDSTIWLNRETDNSNCDGTSIEQGNKISFFELAYSRCCSLICQLLGDRFAYIQKLLLKYIFSTSYVCSLMASDIYIFIYRIIHPHNKTAMCQIIMNLCKLAPPEAVVKGAALVNRLKHPVVNFEHPNYQYILDLG